MNCRSAERQIFAERDGALEPSQRAELADHLATCATCRAVRDRLSATVSAWQEDAARVQVPNPELEWHKVRREIRGAPTSSKHSKLTWVGLPVAGAAAVALGIYIGTGSSPTAPEPKLSLPQLQSAAAMASHPRAEPSTVVYVDEKSGWTFVVAADDSGQHI